MAKKSTTPATPIDPARLASIAQSMFAASAQFQAAQDDSNAAKEALDGLRDQTINVREASLLAIADAARQGGWLPHEIDAGAAVAAKTTNAETEKARATFIGEMKSGAHPNVRDQINNIIGIRDATWDQEREDAKSSEGSSPEPIKKAFHRRYHWLMKLLREAVAGRYYDTAEEAVAFAMANDPDHDAEKAFKKLADMKAALTGIYAQFPDVDIKSAMDCIATVTEDHLKVARNIKLGIVPVVAAPKVVPAPKVIPTVVAATTPPTTPPTTQGVEPARGAIDMLDELLGDMGADPSGNVNLNAMQLAALRTLAAHKGA